MARMTRIKSRTKETIFWCDWAKTNNQHWTSNGGPAVLMPKARCRIVVRFFFHPPFTCLLCGSFYSMMSIGLVIGCAQLETHGMTTEQASRPRRLNRSRVRWVLYLIVLAGI